MAILHESEDDTPPNVIYVKWNATGLNNGSTWSNAFTSLTAAISYAGGSGGTVKEIWVAAGTYKPTLAAPAFKMLNGVAYYGGFAGTETSPSQRDWESNPTTLSGDTAGNDGPNFANYDDNKLHVLTALDTDQTAVLDGFVVTGGSAMGSGAPNTFGGAILAEHGSPTLRNCRFVGNQARYKGGAVYAMHLTFEAPSITDCVFENNRCVYNEGGNSYTGIGGGLMVEFSTMSTAITIERCKFIGNLAALDGGGACMSTMHLTMNDCEFTQNTVMEASGKGGAGLWVGVLGDPFGGNVGDASLTGCVFAENFAQGTVFKAAGMYCTGNGALNLTDCDFTGNTAYGTAGLAAQAATTKLNTTLTRCTFTSNTTIKGVVLSTSTGANAMQECVFADNDGAAASFGNGPIHECVFINNESALSILGTSGSDIRDTVFLNNRVYPGPSSAAKGTVFSNAGTTFTNCLFEDNQTFGSDALAGAVLGDQGDSFSRCTFRNNSSEGRAGAVAGFSGSLPQRLTNCTFVGNSAGTDAGAYYGHGVFMNCLFVGNTAGGRGGAVYLPGGQNKPMSLYNCTIADNHADDCGGVYNDYNGAPKVATLRNCVLWGNTHNGSPDQSAQLVNHEQALFNIGYCDIQDWDGSYGGSGVVSSDPLWMDPLGPDGLPATGDEDFRVQPGSPVIDAGNNGAIQADWADLDGDLNTTEATPIDAGYFARRIDDTSTPDTGVGISPVVDMGAHEFELQEKSVGCIADCDSSLSLDVDDFICFQTFFALGDIYADCDQDLLLSIDDFICFQTIFALGC